MILTESIEKGLGMLSLSTNKNFKKSFEKSHLNMSFESSNDIPIYKTGKEVKEKLLGLLNKEEAEVAELKSKAQEKVEAAGIIPTECVSEWQRKELEESEVPKLISWDFIYNKELVSGMQSQGGVFIESNPPQKTPLNEEQVSAAREYNRLVDELVGCMVEARRMKAIIENLKDGQKLTLSPAMVSSLGF